MVENEAVANWHVPPCSIYCYNKPPSTLKTTRMIKTYLRLAYRSLVKNKLFAFINVFGLAIGLTCCLLISMYIYQELSYDAHQQLGDRLYQLGTASTVEGKENRYGRTPATMVPVMQQEFPEIESFTRLINLWQDDKTLL